ncbi:ABC transporter ATP-binding protein [Actinomadura sp. LCR2-06]|uniref:ABC transporter ATP-binding protein n=1 Tax=Actinomadura violacea TaxID=2819934 RepID=A0ABS3S8F7_9ACTN|nr:ABC transporter ATP-binding protein [Actinomadura violacea]MBO2465156.1 ABC transporter ATP-binding protein [Actinomadura violacea]
MLQITGLTHSYADGHTAIDGLDLTVPDGELLSIVGPSGCGKSTLLRCIAGLIAPTAGTLTLNGAPISGVPDDLAVVFQDYSRSLFPWLTVRDNVALPLRRRGMGRGERRAAAQEALESVGLPDAGRKYPWQLSGGMQQRVSIARALAYKPSLLLMDEPFGSVDAQTREDLEDLVLGVHRTGKMTILLVTHDIDESVYVGDRVVVLNRSPARVHADIAVGLPASRDQIETRGLPEFVRLRAEVGRLVRGGAKVPGAAPAGEAAGPDEPDADAAPAEGSGSELLAKAAKPAKKKSPAKADAPAKSEDASAKDDEGTAKDEAAALDEAAAKDEAATKDEGATKNEAVAKPGSGTASKAAGKTAGKADPA